MLSLSSSCFDWEGSLTGSFKGSQQIIPKSLLKKVAERVDYTGQTIPMTDIQAKVENGKISIPLDVVKEKKMVRFEYEGTA